MLEALLASHRPLGAYEVMDRLAEQGPRPAPITVYRALDFLLENGLAHRIESRNAFVACVAARGRPAPRCSSSATTAAPSAKPFEGVADTLQIAAAPPARPRRR